MSESKYKYTLGDTIYFDMGVNNINGYAKVVGCSTEPMPELGRGWIVELQEPCKIDKKVYPFTHIVVFDVMIKDAPKETPAEQPPA